jgi:hypothetical protein
MITCRWPPGRTRGWIWQGRAAPLHEPQRQYTALHGARNVSSLHSTMHRTGLRATSEMRSLWKRVWAASVCAQVGHSW